MAEKDLLTIDQVAAHYQLTAKTIRELVRQRRFPAPTLVSKSPRWSRAKIEQWFAALEIIEQVTGLSVFGKLLDEFGKSPDEAGLGASKRKKPD